MTMSPRVLKLDDIHNSCTYTDDKIYVKDNREKVRGKDIRSSNGDSILHIGHGKFDVLD